MSAQPRELTAMAQLADWLFRVGNRNRNLQVRSRKGAVEILLLRSCRWPTAALGQEETVRSFARTSLDRPLRSVTVTTLRPFANVRSHPPGGAAIQTPSQKAIFCAAPIRGALWSGLVQQTVQIVARCRSHDLTLFVRLQLHSLRLVTTQMRYT